MEPVRTTGFLVFTVGQQPATEAIPFPKEITSFEPEGEVVFQAQPGAWDAHIRERGWIMRDGDGFRMYYTGYRDRESIRLLGAATSRDGSTWTRDLGNPLVRDVWTEDMMVVPHDGVLQMFAEGKDDILKAYDPIPSIPVSVVIDRQGRIVARHLGIAAMDVFEREISPLF